MSEDEVIVKEAWYVCPVHGPQHHPLGPDTEFPCAHCELEATVHAVQTIGNLIGDWDGETNDDD